MKEIAVRSAVVRVAGDLSVIGLAFLLTALLTLPTGQPLAAHMHQFLPALLLFAAVWCMAANDQRLFVSRRSETIAALLFSVAKTAALAFLFTIFLLALFLPQFMDRSFLTLFGAIAFIAILLLRMILRLSLMKLRRRGYNTRRILVVGANPRAVQLARVLLANEQFGYRVVGFLEDEPERVPYLEDFGIPLLGAFEDLEEILVTRVIDSVYVTLPVRSHHEKIQEITHLCEGVGVPVRLLADLFPLRLATSDVSRIGDVPLLSLSHEPELNTRFALKRLADRLVAAALLLFMSPLMLTLALLIKLESRGPVLVHEKRVGHDMRVFGMFAFRTFRWQFPPAAPASPHPAHDLSNECNASTRVGSFMQRVGLDELPQLLNVVCGQLSLAEPPPPAAKRFAHTALAEQLDHQTPGGQEVDAAMQQRERQARKKSWTMAAAWLAIADTLLILLAYYITVVANSLAPAVVHYSLQSHLPYLLLAIAIWYWAAIDRCLWATRRFTGLTSQLLALGKATGDVAVFSVFLTVFLSPWGLERRFLVTFCVTIFACLLLFRIAYQTVLFSLRLLGHSLRRTLIVGANGRAKALAQAMKARRRYGYIIEGVLDDEPERAQDLAPLQIPYLGAIASLEQAISEKNIDEVHVALPVRSCYEAIQSIAHHCESRNLPVYLLADLFQLRVATNRLMYIEGLPLLSLSTIPEGGLRLGLKRAFDVLVSSLLLLLLSPFLLLIALLIKLESPGPILFAQERVGQNQRRFRMLKFRSMVTEAETLRAQLEGMNEADGPVFKIKNDPRVTRVGRYLRKFSLDELPQLLNVLVGEMSLVGPRPPIPSEVEKYTWNDRRRLSVRPGMTGLWQVSGRGDDIPFSQWVDMDLEYIDTWSLASDLHILLRTFRVVFLGRGA